MKIFLVGLPGTGKTFWGKQLAQKLQLPFFDLDALIEKNEEQSITEIFTTKGEAYFRTLETNTLKQLLAEEKFVLATGGGTPCFNNNITIMLQQGIVIYINDELKNISARIMAEQGKRPLLNNLQQADLIEHLQQLKQQRDVYYHQAQLIFAPNKELIEQLIFQIKAFYHA